MTRELYKDHLKKKMILDYKDLRTRFNEWSDSGLYEPGIFWGQHAHLNMDRLLHYV